MLWLSLIQFIVALTNAIYFCVLYKKAKLVPLPLVLFCVADAITAPFNLWIDIKGSTVSIYTGMVVSWFFTIAEIILLPSFLSNLISKKYNPTLPLIIAVAIPISLKYIFKAVDFDLSLNYLLSGVLISYHCYRVVVYELFPNSVNKQIRATNYMFVYGIRICYISAIPFSIGFVAHLLSTNVYKIHVDSHWVEPAFLIANIIQHIFFFIPFRWNLQRQPL